MGLFSSPPLPFQILFFLRVRIHTNGHIGTARAKSASRNLHRLVRKGTGKLLALGLENMRMRARSEGFWLYIRLVFLLLLLASSALGGFCDFLSGLLLLWRVWRGCIVEGAEYVLPPSPPYQGSSEREERERERCCAVLWCTSMAFCLLPSAFRLYPECSIHVLSLYIYFHFYFYF